MIAASAEEVACLGGLSLAITLLLLLLKNMSDGDTEQRKAELERHFHWAWDEFFFLNKDTSIFEQWLSGFHIH